MLEFTKNSYNKFTTITINDVVDIARHETITSLRQRGNLHRSSGTTVAQTAGRTINEAKARKARSMQYVWRIHVTLRHRADRTEIANCSDVLYDV